MTTAQQTSAKLQVSIRDGVCWMTKTNPAVRNGIDLDMMDALESTIAHVSADPSILAMVIDADGDGFHNGAILVMELAPDLADLTRDDFKDLVARGQKLGNAISDLKIPVIGIACGGAMGGGLELLLRSDFLYCTDTARFSFPEVTLGLVAAWGGTQLASRQASFRKAQEMLLLGEAVDGRRAEGMGLVTRSFADKQALMDHVENVLARLRLCSPASIQWTKACLAARWEGPLAHGEAVEAIAEIETMATGDFVRAVGASMKGQRYDFVTGKTVPRK